jgi:hypothetical protein
MTMNAKNYVPMVEKLIASVQFSAKSPVDSPAGSPYDAAKLSKVVDANAQLLPSSYRASYATPLSAQMPSVVSKLKEMYQQELPRQGEEQALADVTSYADTLVGAVGDWGQAVYRSPLQRFEAVVSNLYRSFLSKDQRASIGLPLVETVPPLVTFAATADGGPFTLPCDGVKQMIGASVGVVSLPGSYAAHPLLWPALAHETGGHDVIHADPGLETELAQRAQALKGLPKGIGTLWAAWMDETAADVYGLLNVGPSFAVSLSAFFSALLGQDGRTKKAGEVRTQIPVAGDQLADPHPVDLLRLYVAMGVVDSLDGLATSTRNDWLSLIQSVATVAGGGVKSIDVVDVQQKQVVQKLPLAMMVSAAKSVGKMIATAKLSALDGHSIQDIETWDDADEQAATNIGTTKGSIVALGDDAQLLAGATVAFLENPDDYAGITNRLNAALDDSFERDPIFGSAPIHSVFAVKRHRLSQRRTPGLFRFPIAVGTA